MSNRFICIHGHFYQPPRESPWLEEIELQDTAHPYHDWNERITAECYAPNAFARILDDENYITNIVSNYEYMSFNFGPTLLSWLEYKKPEIYEAIIDADRRSMSHFGGHGAAMAQVYNHVIMPLASPRDKLTQVRWGMSDFEYRFGRKAEGMWLAETAVNTETLEVLASEGVRFTVLSPYQCASVRVLESNDWIDVAGGQVDSRRPYLCRLPSGRSIALFFYDGGVSQDVAFGGLLDSGENFANRLLSRFSDQSRRPQLVHIATDGETYGHHHRNGEMALSYCLNTIRERESARVTVYGEYLDLVPPRWEARIIEDSSWSCMHGVERWRSDCGCNSGGKPGWRQGWRAPLRETLDWLRDELESLYEEIVESYLSFPWRARDRYIELMVDRSPEGESLFLKEEARADLSDAEKARVFSALEMQRHALLMYTSCGWFFDEISGIETIQILQYAARAMQLAKTLADKDLEPLFRTKLKEAPSNIAGLAHGDGVYERHVAGAVVTLDRVAGHYAVSSLFHETEESEFRLSYFRVRRSDFSRHRAGKYRFASGTLLLRSEITHDEAEVMFAVLHLGDHNVIGGVKRVDQKPRFQRTLNAVQNSFLENNIPSAIIMLDRAFGRQSYLLWNLFKEEQRRVMRSLLDLTYKDVEINYRRVFDSNYSILRAMRDLEMPIPDALSAPVEYILNTDLRSVFQGQGLIDIGALRNAVEEFRRWPFEPTGEDLIFEIGNRIGTIMRSLRDHEVSAETLENLVSMFEGLQGLELKLDLHEAQNIYFAVARAADVFPAFRSSRVRKAFQALATHFQVRIPPALADPENSRTE